MSSDAAGKGVGVKGVAEETLGVMSFGKFEDLRFLQIRRIRTRVTTNTHDTIAPIIPPQGGVELELEWLGEVVLESVPMVEIFGKNETRMVGKGESQGSGTGSQRARE
jgi:hypothetical protein